MNIAWLPDILSSVKEASETILEVYRGDFEVEIKADNSPVTIADKKSNAILVSTLEKTGIIVLAEESKLAAYSERKNKSIWLVDPLDGTKEFIRKTDEFCICIALIENEIPTFGIIADPIRRVILIGGETVPPMILPFSDMDTDNPNYLLKPVNQNQFDNIIYSRTHITPKIDDFIERQSEKYGPINRIRKGSALKFFDLVENTANLYIRLWPTMEWDIAAGHAIYGALGGEVINFTTFAPLTYNKEDLRNPQFIAKPKDLILLKYL